MKKQWHIWTFLFLLGRSSFSTIAYVAVPIDGYTLIVTT
jgi:hypothetical protein